LGVIDVPKSRDRRQLERQNAAILGDDYKFTRDPVLAKERAERRLQRAKALGCELQAVRDEIAEDIDDLLDLLDAAPESA